MSNTLATCSIVAKESLAVLENFLGFAVNCNRDWEDEFPQNQARGYSPGATINIRRPPRVNYRAGRVAVPQGIVQQVVPLTLSQGGTDVNFTSLEKTVSLNKMQPVIMAAMAAVANEIDRQGLALAHFATPNAIGTPGTLPSTQALALAAVLGVNQRLDEEAAPRNDGGRALILNPGLNGAIVGGFAGMFNSQAVLDKQFRRGVMVDSLGLAYAMDQNVDVHTNGTQPVAGGTVNGAGQSGTAITVNAGSITGTITRGSKITFAGSFLVNPQARVSTGTLAQFTVTADVPVNGTVINISPALTPTGQFQNVTASPANAAVITVFGTASGVYNCNVGFHKDAFTLAIVPMFAPPNGNGVVDVGTETHKGMSMKVTQFYDGINDNFITRWDVLFGWAATYPELACILAT